MSNDRFASAHEMVREYQELEKQMADPSIHEDQGKARQLGRRYAQLGPVVAGFNAWKSAADDLEAAKEMARKILHLHLKYLQWKRALKLRQINWKSSYCHVIPMMIAM
jgi:protein subunit release factor A